MLDSLDHAGPDDGLARLRVAAAAVGDLDHPSRGTSDPMAHAERFEALHEALTSALGHASDRT